MTAAIDLTGKIFGRLTVLALGTPISKRRAYMCACECGKQKLVRGECLSQGMTESCGCIRAELTAAINKTHGMSSSPEYKSWAHAKARILNPKNHKFAFYGGRGITMCQEWIDSFDAFFADMGYKPSKKHSLGRIDVNLGYCKENCRWESFAEQARARSDNVYVLVDGVKMILKDACKNKSIDYKKASRNIKLGLWNPEKVFA